MSLIAVFVAWLLSAGNPATEGVAGGIPFAFESNQIILTVSVNGQDSLNFLLDTGTDNSTIDASTAERLGLEILPADNFQGGAPPTAWIRHLKLKSLAVDSLLAWAVDLSNVSRTMGRPLHGVLGYSFLKDRIVQIDYMQHVVRFLDQPPMIEKVGKNVMLPMLFLEGRSIPLFEKLYVGETPVRVTLDTGSSMSLLLYPRTVEALGWKDEAERAPRATALIYGGNAEVRKGPRVRARLQAAVFDSVQVYFAAQGWKDRDPAVRGGTVGNEFFKHARLTMDYKNKQIFIER